METAKEKPLEFVVLVPHRDCLAALEAFRQRLFAGGIAGAYSFPAAAPLALIKRPLSPGELKAAAAETRKLLGGRKITPLGVDGCDGWVAGPVMGAVCFFGLVLELPLPDFPASAVVQRWEKPILAPAILGIHDRPPSMTALTENTLVPPFRSAALANLALMPITGFNEEPYSFTWKIGPLYWLPKGG
jgi:hypothetical protein